MHWAIVASLLGVAALLFIKRKPKESVHSSLLAMIGNTPVVELKVTQRINSDVTEDCRAYPMQQDVAF
jgi:hypothetical protein